MEPGSVALRGSRPMIGNAVMDLPEPDYPTIPSTSPEAIENDTPLTGSTTPSSVGMRTTRSVTARTTRDDRPSAVSGGRLSLLTFDGTPAMRSAGHPDCVVVDVVHRLAVHVPS